MERVIFRNASEIRFLRVVENGNSNFIASTVSLSSNSYSTRDGGAEIAFRMEKRRRHGKIKEARDRVTSTKKKGEDGEERKQKLRKGVGEG